MLPELGGRVHAIKDLTNGYEAIYRQNVIKPALVGLGGPWVSGGIEFNWPQHHRPSTFMPTDVAIQHHENGSVTVWMGEHEPMDRTKGMHGICLYPERSVVEIKARLYNRTPYVQTFLWWTNIGTHVHEGYKSFFPPDAQLVADHAKRAMSTYPLCEGFYYGIDYAARELNGVSQNERPRCFIPAHCGGESPYYEENDLSWYANIPVPTSYMCVGTEQDFLGGYDYFKEAGLLHVADHHISPGKKQWTWGNHEFGYAWDRNLTDADGPYIELMAGVYTDNQPDFSFISPGETRTFSQFLYPYREIGPAVFANVDVAIGLNADRLGIASTRTMEVVIRVTNGEEGHFDASATVSPGTPFLWETRDVVSVRVEEAGKEIGAYRVEPFARPKLSPALEPPLPAQVASLDELFIIGQHLEQYRHATRSSTDYWNEALRRDPEDCRCNNALGLWHFKRGEFEVARKYFETSIRRLTSRNPNPSDGEAFYNLGLVLRFLGENKLATDAFAKAAWNAAWQPAAYHALAELACRAQDWEAALGYLNRAVRANPDNFRANNLRALVLKKLDRPASLEGQLEMDPLDHWARHLRGESIVVDNQVRLDLAIDLMRGGLHEEALAMLEPADLAVSDGAAPMIWYYRAYLLKWLERDCEPAYRRALGASPNYCFPSRLEDIEVLKAAPPTDARAPYYLGNLLYDRRRYGEAIECWTRSVELDPSNPIAHRNLGIAIFNFLKQPDLARKFYDEAIRLAPEEPRYLYERDQLWKRIGIQPKIRLAELTDYQHLVTKRDDLTIEFCALLNAVGRTEECATLLKSRQFQPWEGGESVALSIFTQTQILLARKALEMRDLGMGALELPALELPWAEEARTYLESALNPPQSLGEARHVLANASELWVAYGDVLHELKNQEGAVKWWLRAAEFRGDFQGMAVQSYSELTYFQSLALRRLGRDEEAETLLLDLKSHAESLLALPATIDYFATSLPTMLLFEDDLQLRQTNRAKVILAQVAAGFGKKAEAERLLEEVLSEDPSDPMARNMLDLLRSSQSSRQG
jgi:tetratricopeptide (TPR) repeat protein